MLFNHKNTKKAYATPSGQIYNLYADMLKQVHLLIAGATGSGKSVVINGMIHTALYHSPAKVGFILIDPKRVELAEYKKLPHVLCYASEPDEMVAALQYAMELVEGRYRVMARQGVRFYDGSDVYVIIDEFADLMTTNRKQVQPLIQRLCQIARAARVHVVAATQCPLATVIPTPIRVNFDSRVALRTRSAQDSRNIIERTGCELLPRYGKGFYMKPEGTIMQNIPMYEESERQRLIDFWTQPKRKWTCVSVFG